MEVKQSTCNYCSIACNLDFHVEDNTINHITPTKIYPVNHGFCCTKGLNLDKQNTIYPNPVFPLIRNEQGEFEQISWERAFETFATRIKGIQKNTVKKVWHSLAQGNFLQKKWHFLDILQETI